MKKSSTWILATTLVGVGLFSPERGVAEMASGEILANTCFSCHGTDGKSAGDMPSIAGKSEKFIINTMQFHKEAGPKVTVMNRIARGFSDDEIRALAKFFSDK